MQNDKKGPRKPFMTNGMIGVIALTAAVFMFFSIIYKYLVGF
ncbi:MAG: hypothetical protein ACTSV1_03695 [Alphaproteobacteria bacterium]